MMLMMGIKLRSDRDRKEASCSYRGLHGRLWGCIACLTSTSTSPASDPWTIMRTVRHELL